MPTCFVMQPFDGAEFDRRFRETFKPAIEAAGLEAYRVDQDPKVNIPIQEIEAGIRDAHVCLADITRDNPNVWFELGFAIACKKQVVLVCSDERTATHFPFDVQHRSIVRYSTKSVSDYSALASAITSKLKAYLKNAEALQAASEAPMLVESSGLDHQEVMALATVAQSLDHSDDHIATSHIRREMESRGYTKLATTISLRSLVLKELIQGEMHSAYQSDDYYGYQLTEQGWKWMVENKSSFLLVKPPAIPERRPTPAKAPTTFDDIDDDIPF
jgi:nucleoside 2-deoxyribosyltransferase